MQLATVSQLRRDNSSHWKMFCWNCVTVDHTFQCFLLFYANRNWSLSLSPKMAAFKLIIIYRYPTLRSFTKKYNHCKTPITQNTFVLGVTVYICKQINRRQVLLYFARGLPLCFLKNLQQVLKNYGKSMNKSPNEREKRDKVLYLLNGEIFGL